jgi:hypothetical protein
LNPGLIVGTKQKRLHGSLREIIAIAHGPAVNVVGLFPAVPELSSKLNPRGQVLVGFRNRKNPAVRIRLRNRQDRRGVRRAR